MNALGTSIETKDLKAGKEETVPFVDLSAQYYSIKPQIDEAIRRVIVETAFIGGPHVKEFESAFSTAYGMKHCISCANGTDAIYIILKMLGIGQGDEVITTACSWISTSETITQSGATPVFVDIEPDYFTIDPKKIEEKINSKTRAIIPVHLYGQVSAMNEIQAICEKYKLHLIEDCAQSHFSTYADKNAGSFGIAASFSFYPGKNLGAYGDAGAILTNDDVLAEKCRMYANHGALVKHRHLMEGINSRMDGLQAAILSVKLPHIHEWTQKRIRNAQFYGQGLSGIPQLVTPKIREGSTHSFHLYVARVKQRDKLVWFLREAGIETAIHYPSPLPFLPAYQYLGLNKNDFPVALDYQDKILSLPMFPELSAEKIERVCQNIRKFYDLHG